MDKKEIIKFLRHIGDDFSTDESVEISAECKGQGEEDTCPDHQDCGVCRFEYMNRKGWLNEVKG